MQSVKRTRRETSRLVLTGMLCFLLVGFLAGCETTNGTNDVLQPRLDEHSHPEAVTREDVRAEIETMVGPIVESLVREVSAAIEGLATKDEIGCRTQAPVYLRDLDDTDKNKRFVGSVQKELQDKNYTVTRQPDSRVSNLAFNAELSLEGKEGRSGVTEAEFGKAVDIINALAASQGVLLDWVPYFQCYGGVADLQYVSIAGEAEAVEEETVIVDIALEGTKVLPNSEVHIRPGSRNRILTQEFPIKADSSRLSGDDWSPSTLKGEYGDYTFGKGDKWKGSFERVYTQGNANVEDVKTSIREMRNTPDRIYVMIRRKFEGPIVVRDENNQRMNDSIALDVARYLRFDINRAQGVFRAREIPVHNSVAATGLPLR